ncbi:MAG: hypothetical protein EOO14_16835 [Chitinophagaceae bacterium]|nr:MAG: hypothetical protein EOO14_16835 [Chitinophagaceae bacterium]
MFPTIAIPKLHKEYHTWIDELNFCKEQIALFENQLAASVGRITDTYALAQVEHFQNQFIREKEVIDELKHKLHISEKQLAGFVKDLSGLGLESIRMDNHSKLREDMHIFRKIYTGLKEDFRRFESEHI